MTETPYHFPADLFPPRVADALQAWREDDLLVLENLVYKVASTVLFALKNESGKRQLTDALHGLFVQCLSSTVVSTSAKPIYESQVAGLAIYEHFCTVLGVRLVAEVSGPLEKFEQIENEAAPIAKVLDAVRSFVHQVIVGRTKPTQSLWSRFWKKKT